MKEMLEKINCISILSFNELPLLPKIEENIENFTIDNILFFYSFNISIGNLLFEDYFFLTILCV